MKRFELFLSDESIVSGHSVDDWLKTPNDEIQAVVVLHADGFAQEQIHGFNYYILTLDNKIIGVDVLETGAAKAGELIETEKFNRIIDELTIRSEIWDRSEGN